MDKSSSPRQSESPPMPNISEPTYEQSATEPGAVTMRWKVNVAIDLDVSELGEAFRVAGVEANHDQIANVAEAIMHIMARKAPQAHQMPLSSPLQAPPVQPIQSPSAQDAPSSAPIEAQSSLQGTPADIPSVSTPGVAEPPSLPVEVQPVASDLLSSLPDVSTSIPEGQNTLPGTQARR
ncbi:hypothetical protein MPH_05945 [Macrophomina phaseolina MS6]|uniref:Uncharacterized protein n=1 Tax=Macrophomina phaseolina (strain MS6) TaxID=1126212 RepID=K2RVS9_MACPH|nr:hypothetical protein MPH_05945 [Macrophomina phaseolina MS6]